MNTTVWTTVHAPGFHHWPHAPLHRSYLADRHRHLFRLTAWVKVSHDDRDIEFHDLQDIIRTWWGPAPREWGSTSCEAMARQLWDTLIISGLTPARVEVSEDGESGAVLEPNERTRTA